MICNHVERCTSCLQTLLLLAFLGSVLYIMPLESHGAPVLAPSAGNASVYILPAASEAARGPDGSRPGACIGCGGGRSDVADDLGETRRGSAKRCRSLSLSKSWVILPFAFVTGGLLNVESFTKSLPIVL